MIEKEKKKKKKRQMDAKTPEITFLTDTGWSTTK